MKFFKNITWSFFILVILCAFLPFANVSCSGKQVATMTGASLCTGTKISFAGHEQDVKPEPRVIAVYALCLISGILLLLKKTRKAFAFAMILSLACFGLLSWCKLITDQMVKQNPGSWSLSYDTGCYATIILLALCLIFSAIFAFRRSDEKPVETGVQNNGDKEPGTGNESSGM